MGPRSRLTPKPVVPARSLDPGAAVVPAAAPAPPAPALPMSPPPPPPVSLPPAPPDPKRPRYAPAAPAVPAPPVGSCSGVGGPWMDGGASKGGGSNGLLVFASTMTAGTSVIAASSTNIPFDMTSPLQKPNQD